MEFLIDFILHIDQHMVEMVRDYHAWTYAILFVIIFCETGLVVTPFLPGDSLLFVAGAIAAQPNMPITVHLLFYKKYGGKTIILARFVPIVRTFAPFVAGMGKMHYYYFMVYNVVGGALWVAIFCYAGFFFGDLPFVQQNLKLLIVAIIVISVLPAVVEVIREKMKLKKEAA